MLSLYWLIPLGLLVMLILVLAFFMSIKSGQYDDLDSPAHRILMDDNDPRIPNAKPTQQQAQKASSELPRDS
ncbi:MAG: cbb3-type cytochrome oxidase assembly protein CcoS [bacterium]